MTPHLKDIVEILEKALTVHQKQKQSYLDSFMKDATSALQWGSGVYYNAVACDNITWLLNILWRHEITKDADRPAPMVTIAELQAIVMRTLLERANDPMNSTSDGCRAIHKAEIQFWARASTLLQQDHAVLDKNFRL